jgi:anaerobic dimethyl sulfoxide reductase subunit C (anchor subunit)
VEEKFVANLEEVRPHAPSGWEEMPLIVFTLLTQMAVGGFWAMLWTFPGIWNGMARFQPIPQILIGVCLAAGMLASLAHLGTKKNAWRALRNLRKSWLSREVLFTGLFGAGWLFTTAANLLWYQSTIEGLALTAAFGLGLVYSMSRVYRLPAIPAWNTRRTNLVFIVSALLPGQTLMGVLSPYGSNLTGSILLVLLLAQLVLIQKSVSHSPLRTGLILAGMILTISSFLLGSNVWLSSLILLAVLAEAGIGRWEFYRAAQEPFVSS